MVPKYLKAHKIAQVVGEGEELEPNSVVEEVVTGEPGPVEGDLPSQWTGKPSPSRHEIQGGVDRGRTLDPQAHKQLPKAVAAD